MFTDTLRAAHDAPVAAHPLRTRFWPRNGRSLVRPSLKIHDPTADLAREAARGATVFDDLCAAFQKATGWSLRLHLDRPGEKNSDPTSSNSNTSSTGVAPGTVSLELSPGPLTSVRTPRKLAEPLARAIARLMGEVAETRHALWQREAELAAGVPVAARPAEPEVLAERLDAILRGGCEALECSAAALYLLDQGTTELKLRAAWGLARYKLTEPPRPLRGATADLEALTGHAVVLANEQLCRLWHAPEPVEAALCVPVASPTLPLGTLWFFARAERDFDDRQTQLAELVAGRIAAELEREVLLGDAAQRTKIERGDAAHERWAADNAALPKLDVPGWSLAANHARGSATTPAFADAFFTDHGTLAVVLGAAQLAGPEGNLAIAAARTAVRAHAMRLRRASAVLEAAYRTISAAFAGSSPASLAVAIVHPRSGYFHFAATGSVQAVIRRHKRPRFLHTSAVDADNETVPRFVEERGRIAVGEQLILITDPSAPSRDRAQQAAGRTVALLSGILKSAAGAAATAVAKSIEDALRSESANASAAAGQLLVVARGESASLRN